MNRKVVGWMLISIPLTAIGSIVFLSMISEIGFASAMIVIILAVAFIGCIVVGLRLIL